MAGFVVASPDGGTFHVEGAPDAASAAAVLADMPGASAPAPAKRANPFADLIPAGPAAPSAPAAPAATRRANPFADLIEKGRRVKSAGVRDRFKDAFDNSADDMTLRARLEGGSIIDPISQGLTMGFGDEILGTIMGGLTWAAGQGFDKGYDAITTSARRDLEAYRARHPVVSTVAEIAGSVPSAAVPIGVGARGASLGARMLAGAGAGAGYGAVTGFGAGEGGFGERLTSAGEGAAVGGALGAVVPAATAGIRAVAKPVVNAITARTNPGGFAARKVADRLAASGGRSIDQATARIERAGAAGQSMRLADAGGASTRDLLRTASNIPGPGRDAILTKANLDNVRQGGRIKSLIADVFADPDNAYQAAKVTVMDARSRAATPHFEAAWRTPVPFTHDLEALLNTPAGRAGLAAARTNTLNRREPWAQWFLNVADDGSIIDARRVPDSRALHEIKRVLDQMVEAAKAAPDGSPFAKARATPQSIAIQTVRDDLNNFLKRHNAPYRRAMAESLDNIQADEALEFGRNALSSDPRVIARRMGDPAAYGRDKVFNEGERELARVGLAEALRAKIDKMGDTHNVMGIFKTPQLRAQIAPFFRSKAERGAFARAIITEARKARTNVAPTQNSTTARQLLDAAEANGSGDALSSLGRVASGGGVLQTAISALVAGLRRIGGFTPQVAAEVGRMLMEADPAVVRAILERVRTIEASRASAGRKAQLIRSAVTTLLGGQAGREFGYAQGGLPAPQ